MLGCPRGIRAASICANKVAKALFIDDEENHAWLFLLSVPNKLVTG